MNTRISKKLFNESRKFLVGGVNSPVRAFNAVGQDPLVISHGRAQKFFDVDGNSYTDYCLSWGSLIHGHNHPQLAQAAKKSLGLGTSFGTTTKAEIEIARFIVKHVPSIDLIRFVNSGTEATMSAIRLARGFTGRDKVIKFDGCYHGHSDDLLTAAGSGVSFLPTSSSRGIPKSHVENTLSLPFNDLVHFAQIIERHHKDIACVIMEPVAGNMGVITPNMDFFKAVRHLTKKYNIVLIFDEVMSGFRTNLGCVQKDFNIIPDMTCLGKIIGGGFPVGAYGGRRDIMEHLSPLGKVYQAGTFAGNPVVMATGLASLELLTPANYRALNLRSKNFVEKVNASLLNNNINAHLSAFHSMVSIRFRKEAVHNYAQAQNASSSTIYPKLFHFLLNEGIYWPPADLESFFISTRHTEKDLNLLASCITKFFIQSQ